MMRSHLKKPDIGVIELLIDQGMQLPNDASKLNEAIRAAIQIGLRRELIDELHKNTVITKGEGGDTQLMVAARSGDLEMLNVYLKNNNHRRINFRNERGSSALLCAITSDANEDRKIEICRSLLLAGADPNATDFLGNSPMHACAEIPNSKEVMNLIVEFGGDISAINGDGVTPLFRAVNALSLSNVKHLQALGADLRAKDLSKRTVFHELAKTATALVEELPRIKSAEPFDLDNELKRMCEYFRLQGVDACEKDAQGYVALPYLASARLPNTTTYLMSTYREALRSTEIGKFTLRYLLGLEPALERNSWSVRRTKEDDAADHLRHEQDRLRYIHDLPDASWHAVRTLMSSGVNLDTQGLNPLIAFIKTKNTTLIDAALANEALLYKTDSNGTTPLMIAIGDADIDTSEKILERHRSTNPSLDMVNQQRKNGFTALHLAARTLNEQAVNLLLQYGADPDIRTIKGDTPLMLIDPQASADPGKTQVAIDIAGALLGAGANINAENHRGESAFLGIDKDGTSSPSQFMGFLLSNGAEIHHRNGRGDLVAHKLINKIITSINPDSHLEKFDNSLSLLVEHGYDLNKPNDFDMTPLRFFVDYLEKTRSNRTRSINAKKDNSSLYGKITESLLTHGASPNDLRESTDPLLISAIRAGEEEVALKLIEYGADTSISGTDGVDVLQILMEAIETRVVEGPRDNSMSSTLLQTRAIAMKHIPQNVMQYLSEKHKEEHALIQSLILKASHHNDHTDTSLGL